ncbi:MAG: DUF3035 domain-containing protein [Sphingomonadaceae bacterium]|nr:DUF3035 domain-containing protein [Sphingomonadaceae bacterium]
MRKMMVASVLALSLAGCGHASGVFGHARPDEFAVTRAQPLIVPPDFALVPPKPGAPRPQEADSSTQALQAMFGGPAARSAGETGTLNEAGANRAAEGIRSNAGDPTTTVVDKGGTTRDIVAAPEGDGQDARATAATPAPAPAARVPPK